MGKEILTYIAIVITLFSATPLFAQEKANKETIKQAEESFIAGNYTQAKKLYNQLVTYYPKDPNYNYRYGASILFTESDKAGALKYLEFAVTKPDVDAAAYYYLGKGYHYNYRFNEAIKYFNQFKSKASPKELKTVPVEQELRMANNGFGLLKDVSEPKVYEKKQLSARDFYLSYQLPEGEKLVKLPSFLRSSEDKTANYAPLVKIKKGSDRLFVSGKVKGANHTDLYMLILDDNGDLTQRVSLDILNSDYDEDYPYFDEATNMLYFSSKGHTSMGGFDLFRSKYNPNTGSFSAPVNLDYAYNTPDDDLLYVPSVDGFAYFSSTRNNDAGKISVFKVDSARRGLQHILLVGNYKADGSNIASITVEDSETGEKQAPFQTRSRDGFYAMKIKANHKYRFLVEPEGSQTIHAGMVEIPKVSALKPLRQEMFIVADGDREKLVIKNLFDEAPNPDDELLIANFLKDLGSLDQEQEIERNIALSNDEILADLETRKETLTSQANELNGYVASAYSVAQEKSNAANDLIKEEQQLASELPSDQSSEEYKAQKEVLEEKQVEAKLASIEAASAVEYAKTLEKLAKKRSSEAAQIDEVLQKGKQLNTQGKRNDLIQSYLAVNEEVIINNKPVKTQARNTIDNEAIQASRKAAEAKLRYQDLFDDEEKLKKTIAFTEGQVKQAKKAKMKEQLEADLAIMREDLEDLSPKVQNAYTDFKKKEAIANTLGDQNSAVGQTMANIEPSTTTESQDYASIRNQVDQQYQTTSSYDVVDDYQFRADQADNTEDAAEEVGETVPVSEEEALTDFNENSEESASVEETSELAYNVEESPYNEHFTNQERSVASIQDPIEQNAAMLGVLTAKNSAIDEEIDYLEAEDPVVYSDRIAELENQKQANETQIESLSKESLNQSDVTAYQPTEEMMSYPSIQDMEDQYYFEYENTQNKPFQDQLETTNEVNERYITQIDDNVASLSEARDALPPSSSDYKSLQNEIDALEDLSSRKRSQVDYNNKVLAAAKPESYAMTGLAGALAANTISVPSEETGNEEELTDNSSANESEEIAEVISEEVDTATETEEPEAEPIQEETESAIQPEELAATETTTSTTTEPVDEDGVPSGGFQYFTNIDEVRSAPIHVGRSPYNDVYDEQISAAENIEDPVTRTNESLSANESLLLEINKEIESLSYMSANAGSESTKAVLDDKIITLRDQRSGVQAEVNRLNALQTQLSEEGFVADDVAPTPEPTIAEEIEEPVVTPTPVAVTPVVLPEELITENSTESEAESTPEVEESSTAEPVTAEENEVETNEFTEPVEVVENNEPTEEVESNENINEEFVEEESILAVNEVESQPTDTVTNTDLPLVDVSSTDEGIAALEVITTQYEEEADLAQTSFTQADDRVGQLQNELVKTRKKKDKQAIQKQLDQANEDLIMQKAMLKWANAKVENVSSATATLMADPLASRPSELYLAQANKKQDEAQFKQQEIQEKRDELGATRKKKQRKALQVQLDELVVEGKQKNIDAEQSQEMAIAIQEAEVITLKNATPFGSSLVVEFPETDRTLTNQEQEQIAATDEYKSYVATQESFTKRIQEADVIYASAAQLEEEGRALIAQATESTGDEADSLQVAGKQKVEEALNLRQQAKETSRNAYFDMNTANLELLAIEDVALRTDVIAITQGGFSALTYTEEGEIDIIPSQLTADIFQQESDQVAYYNEDKPIPVDVELPEGVIFKVQVGAFRNPIPSETFRGFAPIVGENTGTGLTRYTAGLFKSFDNADQAKVAIRDLGYSDAFVVAYRNGERISLAEARGGSATGAAQGGTIAVTAPVPVGDNPLNVTNQPIQELADGQSIDVSSVADRAPLFYTVQIGVYSSEVAPEDLFNISPINSDLTPSGLIRYSTGVFNTVADASAAKDQIVAIGIVDAFVTAYRNGQRVSVSEAQQTTANSVTTPPANQEVEEAPSVVTEAPEEVVETPAIAEQDDEPETITIDGAASDVLPPATAESNNAYRVKVGPYQGQVPVNEAGVILDMNSVGITIKKEGESTIYYIGNYRTQFEADRLLQIVNSKGLPSAEVVKFENGSIVE
jgi:hypothetical protein